ncbi:PREDICTED: putative glycine-rich cell wall structural protein 1, partial [Nipponia nippon]|uniref:putative glycine-rich cell wall structural protein 1 n=1 Tax=Nipponia nippon TaxID=128390 RepID=UPI00051114F9
CGGGSGPGGSPAGGGRGGGPGWGGLRGVGRSAPAPAGASGHDMRSGWDLERADRCSGIAPALFASPGCGGLRRPPPESRRLACCLETF